MGVKNRVTNLVLACVVVLLGTPVAMGAPNAAPVLKTNIPLQSIPEDNQDNKGYRLIDLSKRFEDDGGAENLTFSVVTEEDPAHIDATVDGRFLSFSTPTKDWYGQARFQVRATDAGGLWMDSNNFTVRVTAVNDPPFFIDMPATLDVNEDEKYTLDLRTHVGDVDTDLRNLSLSEDSPHASIDYTGGNYWNITFEYDKEIGTEPVKLSLSDTIKTVNASLEVRVRPVNDRPVVLPRGELAMVEDTEHALELTAFAADEEDAAGELEWRVESVSGNLSSATVDGKSGLRMVPAANLSGPATVRLAVRDTGGAEASFNLSVIIAPVNDPPYFRNLTDFWITEDTIWVVDFKQYLGDADNPVTELRLTSPSPHVFIDNLKLEFLYTEEVGTDRIIITISDGIAMTTTQLDIIVVPVNDPPVRVFVLDPANSSNFTQGAKISFNATAWDQDDPVLNFTWRSDGMEFGKGKTLETKSLKPGKHNITVTASDGSLNTTTPPIQITILKKPRSPQPGIPGFGPLATLLAALCAIVLSSREPRGPA